MDYMKCEKCPECEFVRLDTGFENKLTRCQEYQRQDEDVLKETYYL